MSSVTFDSATSAVPQQFVGRVNVVGDCFCFGLALDRQPPLYRNVPVYVSVAGPATSVEAVWAKLAQGKESHVIRDDAPALALEPADKGQYTRFQRKIPGLGIDHLILLHRDLTEPVYPTEGEAATTYVFWLHDPQGEAKLGEHVRKTVKVAVFDAWYAYLHTAGRSKGLVQTLITHGSVNVIRVSLDATRWTDLIAQGLKMGQLHFPT